MSKNDFLTNWNSIYFNETLVTSYMKMNEFKNISTDSKKDCLLLLNVTFTKGTGDLRIEIPAVPG